VVGADAHVSSEVAPGSRIAREAVQDVAAWMVSFRASFLVNTPRKMMTSKIVT